MDNNPPISADELQIEFDRLKGVFRGDNSFAKFDASAEMMVLISRYLSNNIQSIDVEPITTVLEEYARIANGGKPEFIKSQKSGGGRPSDPGNQMHSASIVASVDILAKNGYSVSEAIRFVAEELGRKERTVKQLRSDFNRRQVLPEIENFKRQQSSFVFVTKNEAKIHVLALLAMVKADVN
jgi:uncharacterized protein YoaH (UPF0181 family)